MILSLCGPKLTRVVLCGGCGSGAGGTNLKSQCWEGKDRKIRGACWLHDGGFNELSCRLVYVNTWSPVGHAIFENFGKWGLVGQCRSLGFALKVIPTE